MTSFEFHFSLNGPSKLETLYNIYIRRKISYNANTTTIGPEHRLQFLRRGSQEICCNLPRKPKCKITSNYTAVSKFEEIVIHFMGKLALPWSRILLQQTLYCRNRAYFGRSYKNDASSYKINISAIILQDIHYAVRFLQNCLFSCKIRI